ncbi:MAG: DUF2779 domain-containing protein [Balneolaceae bacterium]|nr:DUF2779 domain-containing protein [Balneolaceae bacterium]
MRKAQSKTGRRYFTRHLFRSGCTCPSKLYYKSDSDTYPEKFDGRPFMAHIRFNRNQLTKLLKAGCPGGIRVDRDDYASSAHTTSRELEQKHTVLFNAVFVSGRYVCRVPVLEKEGERLRIYRIRSRAFDPDRHSLTNTDGKVRNGWRGVLLDFAYQMEVIRRQYPGRELECRLVLPHKTNAARVDRLDRLVSRRAELPPEEIDRLLAKIPVTDYVQRYLDGRESPFEDPSHPLNGKPFVEVFETLAGWYFNREKVFSGVGIKCKDCEFRLAQPPETGRKSGFRECWKEVLGEEVDEPHIFDLIGAGTGSLLENGVYLQKNVPVDLQPAVDDILASGGAISDHDRRLLQLGKNRGLQIPRELVRPDLFRELERWEYPIHFLDFEAGSFAIPLRAGRSPYHLVVFQYSCHTLLEDGTLHHHEWLHDDVETYPNYRLAEALKKVPGIGDGTLVQYSGFERSAMKRIAKELRQEPEAVADSEELISWMREMAGRDDSHRSRPPYLADLSRLVKHYYYNIEMEDSLSIKDVLRSVMEISPVLEKRFSVPYQSPHFDGITWWQRKGGRVRNPYDILRKQQPAPVGRGTEAMAAYSRLRSGTLEATERKRLRSALKSYCELDTLAMVMIYLHWAVLLDQQQ